MTVHVEFAKWGGRRHWTYDALRLGEDAHGVWLGGPRGTVLDRPDARLVLDYPSIVLVRPGRPRVAAFNADAPTDVRSAYEVYLDVPRGTDRTGRA